MNKLLSLAAVAGLLAASTPAATFWLSVPALAAENAGSTEQDIQAMVTDISATRRGHHSRTHRAHHDRGLHRGFSHSRHLGYGKH